MLKRNIVLIFKMLLYCNSEMCTVLLSVLYCDVEWKIKYIIYTLLKLLILLDKFNLV